MATSYLGAVQVGSYFVVQYYQVLQQQQELIHQFYCENSNMVRVDGKSSWSASAIQLIFLGEFKFVYVRNLPSDVTAAEIEEFKNFGRIKLDCVFIRSHKDVPGVCYAFVEFEDIPAVQNAIKACPIQLAGRQVYIEEQRPNSGSIQGGRVEALIHLKPKGIALVVIILGKQPRLW